jgi:hypothetical protein
MYAIARYETGAPAKMPRHAQSVASNAHPFARLQDCGGEAPLAAKLGVSIEVLSGWLRGHELVPPSMYLRARYLAGVRRR